MPMCDGKYTPDPEIAASHKKIRYVRSKASYFLRGRYRKIGGKNCVYCGFKANTGDHVPALFIGFINGITKGVIVSSCYDCNKYLGSFSSTCLKERSNFLFSTYEKERNKYAIQASTPGAEIAWTEKANAFSLKMERCKQRIGAINCNMLENTAALFSQNGESGGEITLYDSLVDDLETAHE